MYEYWTIPIDHLLLLLLLVYLEIHTVVVHI